MTKGILGKKVGMTQIFTEAGELIPVTVIEATPNAVSYTHLLCLLLTHNYRILYVF